jgi:hypothetical protein
MFRRNCEIFMNEPIFSKYSSFIASEGVRQKHIPCYIGWLHSYLNFCLKHSLAQHNYSNIPPFQKELKETGKANFQLQQAVHSVILFAVAGQAEPDTPYRRKCRMTWAALIKLVYEVDPLKCPRCGGTMKIVGFIEGAAVIENILRHCNLWKEPAPRPPPAKIPGPPETESGPSLDYRFFENCV